MSGSHFSTRILLAGAMAAMTLSSAEAAPVSQDVVRAQSNQSIVVNTFGNCVRTRWGVETDPCAPEAPDEATPVRRVWAEEERTIYFGFNQATLTPEARQKLDTLANTLKSEQDVKEAKIVGYADRIGSANYNQRLSQKRAEAVKNYIISRGFVNARVAETRWFGETTPVTSCPDTLSREALIACLQKDRRVEVEIEYQPELRAN